MKREDIILLAKEAGFAAVNILDTKQLVFIPEYRRFCEENACGNYNNNYGCPPYCGTPKEMEARVLRYENAVVFQSKTPVKDIFDNKETKEIKKKHTGMTRQALDLLRCNGMEMDGFPIMAGPCNLCDECRMPKGEACIMEDSRFSCLSAYGINAAQLAEDCGMELLWDGKEVYFFSLYVFGRISPQEMKYL